MGREDPLGHPELLAIDGLLDAGELDQAQQRLAQVGRTAGLDAGTSYLATRLLYLRGRLDAEAVAQRLRDLLAVTSTFPEARRMLVEAERGSRPSSQPAPRSAAPSGTYSADANTTTSNQPAPPSGAPSRPAERAQARKISSPVLELGFASTPVGDLSTSEPVVLFATASSESAGAGRGRRPGMPAIPRAPGLPHFGEPPSAAPSPAAAAPSPAEPPSAAPSPAEPPSAAPSPAEPPSAAPSPAEPPSAAPSPAEPPSAAPSPAEPLPHASTLSDTPGEPPRGEPPDPPVPKPRRVRSAAPPAPSLEPDVLPSLFELATLLDEGEHRRIIDAIDPAADIRPDYVLMLARAHGGEGHRDEARATLARLIHAPLLDPELRAGAARTLLDLGDLPDALEQARQAHNDDPASPQVRLTLAWTLLRTARRQDDPGAVAEASELLSGLETRGGPRTSLVAALRALVQAHQGDPARAISAARRALALDANSTDALAAIALASARLGRAHDAQQTWLRLLELCYEEADAISDQLEAQGIDLADPDPSARPGAGGTDLFEPIERMLGEARRSEAITAFEKLTRGCLTHLAERNTEHDFSIIAPVAASFLATTPISRDFAPYDLSLWSITRVDALLDTLYGDAPHPHGSDDFPVILLLGSYVGEAIRGACGARWEGSVARIDTARVVIGERSWSPFEMLRARIEHAAPLDPGIERTSLKRWIAPGREPGREPPQEPGREPWSHRVINPVTAPCPWDPLPWPPEDTLEQIGRALARSPIGAYCAGSAGTPLDLSLSSLTALDRYLEIIAPPGAEPEHDAPWARRLAALLGSYVGETLRARLGGDWQSTGQAASTAYYIHFGSGDATPITAVLDRVEGRSSVTLADYARDIASA